MPFALLRYGSARLYDGKKKTRGIKSNFANESSCDVSEIDRETANAAGPLMRKRFVELIVYNFRVLRVETKSDLNVRESNRLCRRWRRAY